MQPALSRVRAIVHIPSYLQTFSGGSRREEVTFASTVRDALEALRRIHPGVAARVVDEAGKVRQHVNVFVGNENVRDLGGLDTTIGDGVEIFLLPSVSGGVGGPVE